MIDTTRDIAAAIRREVIPEGAKRLGLVIGIDRHQDARLDLRCARADAEAMRNLMLDPECGLFDGDNVTLLADEDATRERIWRALAGLRRRAHKQDSVWIFYAGHGAPEGDDVYWVPHDGDVDDLYSTGLSRRDLNRVLDDLQAERVVAFMDCCHAAAMAAQKDKTRAVLTAEAAFAPYKGRGRLIFAASDGREKSVEIANEGRGAFSYFLEHGLRGEADAGHSGIVTADGLWVYLKDKVSAAAQAAGNPQTPVRIGEETHDFALTLNPLEFGRRKRIAEAIKAMVGVGTDQLTTEEGRICLDLLRRGAKSDCEQDMMDALDSMIEGKLRLNTIRRMINDVRNASSQNVHVAAASVTIEEDHKPKPKKAKPMKDAGLDATDTGVEKPARRADVRRLTYIADSFARSDRYEMEETLDGIARVIETRCAARDEVGFVFVKRGWPEYICESEATGILINGMTKRGCAVLDEGAEAPCYMMIKEVQPVGFWKSRLSSFDVVVGSGFYRDGSTPKFKNMLFEGRVKCPKQ